MKNDGKLLSRINEIIKIEIDGLKEQLGHIDRDFIEAVNLLSSCSGKIVIIGIGKSGIIGRKIAATFVSLGVPSVFIHPGDLTHGDLGIITLADIVILISYSGESEELKKAIPFIKKTSYKTVAVTGKSSSFLAKTCDLVIDTGIKKEACKFNLAPTASTTAMLAMGDALALTVAEKRGITEKIYARYHPGGSIGKKLTLTVEEIMRTGKANPVINENSNVMDALIVMTKTKLGAASVVDGRKILVGYFTDGDLRRKLQNMPNLLNVKISEVMTRNPRVVTKDKLAVEAVRLMKKYNCDNLPVVDGQNRLIGIIDERDLITAGVL